MALPEFLRIIGAASLFGVFLTLKELRRSSSLKQVNRGFNEIYQRFDEMEKQVDEIDKCCEKIESKVGLQSCRNCVFVGLLVHLFHKTNS